MIKGQTTLHISQTRFCQQCDLMYDVFKLKDEFGATKWIGKYCSTKCKALGVFGIYTNVGRR